MLTAGVAEERDHVAAEPLLAGVVGRRKHGNYTYYRIVDEGVFALCEQVCGTIERRLLELSSLLEKSG